MGRLWVCWTPPSPAPGAEDSALSFLPPAAEDELERECGPRLLRAREASRPVRAEALRLYLDLTSRIGTTVLPDGRTFRRSLCPPDGTSPWWHHPSSFHDCESDPAFGWIIALLTVRAVARDRGASGLVLLGAPPELREVLSCTFQVESRGGPRRRPTWFWWLRGLGARARWAAITVRQLSACRRVPQPPGPFAVALAGFWDWSVWPREGGLVDRYFKALPAELDRAGLSKAWFAWLDPDGDPARRGRPLALVLSPLRGRADVVLLQSFLGAGDVAAAYADFRPALSYLSARRCPAFRKSFLHDGMDLYPLFEDRLLRGFLDSSLPRARLMTLAAQRACRRYAPKAAVTFLEHHLDSRAFYDGARRAGAATLRCAMQHASYAHEKTFIHLHPGRELCGEPDGCPVPHPDHVFAMGSLGRRLFLECGYPEDRVHPTGSARFDDFHRAAPRSGPVAEGGQVRLLIISSLTVDVEVEMAEAAFEAARGLPWLRLAVRDHPFSRMADHPRFRPLAERIAVTRGTLDEDLAAADVLLFSYSTVAEEALLAGKPAWQWLPMTYNGSALAEVARIPQFSSAARLRQALEAFRADPEAFRPSAELRARVLEGLFHPADGQAAARIARTMNAMIGPSSEK